MKSLKLHLPAIVCVLVSLCPAGWAATNLPIGDPVSGTISSFAQVNRYTLEANAGDVLDFTLLSTSSSSGTFSAAIQLVNSTGTVLDSAYAQAFGGGCSGGNTVTMDLFTVPATATYTVLIYDCQNTNEGDYTLYTQRMNNPPAPATLPYSQAVTGTVAAMPEMNGYTFTANANDVIDFTILSTSSTSGTFSPLVKLFNAAGVQLQSAYPEAFGGGCSGGNTLKMGQIPIPATGTYYLFVGDCSLWNTGNYSLWMQKMNSPPGASEVLFDQDQTGSINALAQQTPYTFSVAAGDTVDLIIDTTTGLLSPYVQLFKSDGTLLQTAYPEAFGGGCSGGASLNVGSLQLSGAGTYSLFVSDCTSWNTGSYQFSTQCFGTCPLPAPTLTSMSPPPVLVGSGGFTLTVNGSNFVNVESNSVVQWSGADLPSTWVSSNQMTAAVPGTATASAGAYPVTVFTPGPGGGTSNSLNFYVEPAQASVAIPVPGSVLQGPSATFTWLPAYGATGYQLWLGSTGVGSYDIYYSGAQAATSLAVSHIPTNGETIYARLITIKNGIQSHNDYTYTAAMQASLASPACGSTLLGPNATFSWAAATGASPGYQLWLGSTGAGSYDLYYSGPLTVSTVAVAHLPTNGEAVYARLITSYSGVQVHEDCTFTATNTALVTPAAGTTLSGPDVTLSWQAASGATGYQLWLGSTGQGSYNLYYEGAQTGTSVAVAHIPTNGETIYAQLITHFGGVEVYNNYTFTAATQAALSSPAPGGTLPGPSATFAWTPGTGATNYQLWLGSSGVGSYNVYYSGPLTGTGVAVVHIPTNGETIYARLATNYGGVQVYADATYTAATQSALSTPTPGSTLAGPSATFEWTSAASATGYQLWLGSTGAGSYNLYYSGAVTGNSATVNRLPTNGEKIYARLITIYSGVQVYTDYTFTAQ